MLYFSKKLNIERGKIMKKKNNDVTKVTASAPEVEEVVEAKVEAEAETAAETTEATAEEKTETKESIRAEIDKLLESRNRLSSKTSHDLIVKKDAEIDKLVKKYTGIVENECFAELKKSDNPLRAAAVQLSFKTICIKNASKDADSDEKKVDEKVKAIDPEKLNGKVSGGIGHNKKEWIKGVRNLGFQLTSRAAIENGIDPKTISDSYAMSKQADQIKALMYDAKKYKKDQADKLTKSLLQEVVNDMVGEITDEAGEKVLVSDDILNNLLHGYTKLGKKQLSIACLDHSKLMLLMMQVCHCLITGDKFTLEYKIK